mmetsp:Transcript_29029/g.52882  ORF Transcript_29029/g.52882 Transcript_29029/m.52882 type:complete len:300 (-) Transcript_29029:46-945(-)
MSRLLWFASCASLCVAVDAAGSSRHLRHTTPTLTADSRNISDTAFGAQQSPIHSTGVHGEPPLADDGHNISGTAFGIQRGPIATMDLHAVACYLKSTLANEYNAQKKPAVLQEGTQSCAVVSSSGALLDHLHGADIDSHDIVLRFNGAPTLGYEEHVGGKTEIRFGWKFHQFEGDANIFKASGTFKSAPAQRVLDYLYPQQLGVSASAETDHPTTGFYGMMLMLFHCATVDAYEMAPSREAHTSPYSYYRDVGHRAYRNSWHGHFESEHDLWYRLSSTPTHTIESTGKSHYQGFRHVNC